MAKPKRARALLLIFSMSIACIGLQASVYSGEVLPWGVERIHADCVWDNNRDRTVDEGANAGNGFLIAVIDSGIDYYVNASGYKIHHPDLADNVFGGATFRWDGNQVIITPNVYRDEGISAGHGTHVAGTILAVDNDSGVIGVAPKAYLYVLKLVTWDYREVVAAINHAVDIGVKVTVISLGTYNNFPDLENACNNAYAKGKLLFAASGNYNSSISYPAKYNNSVISVGAVDQNGQRWVDPGTGEGSNFGPELEFVAPGVDINSTCLNETYTLKSATSMACPHVAGVAALIWSSKPDPVYTGYTGDVPNPWNNTSVRAKLKEYALDLGPTGRDDEYGYGLINAWATNQRPLCDVNNDLKVDLEDVLITGNAFGSSPGHPAWAPRADIDINNKVDLKDYFTVVQNYGKVDP